MTNSVPLTPPAWYTHVSTFPTRRNGVFYVGDTVTFNIAASGPTAYTVYDFYGNTVVTGSCSGTAITLAAPSGGYIPGWYRVVMTGPNTDATFGTVYCVTNFCVIRSNPNFPTMTVGFGAPQPSFDGGMDPTMKGALGIGTSRMQIDHPNAPTTGEFTLAVAENFAENYWDPAWTTPGSGFLDPARPRYLWCSFPNGSVDVIGISATSGTYLWVYCADGSLDGSTVFVTASGVSGTGCTITVSHPSGTTVETWTVTSAANAQAQINAASGGSAYIRVFVPGSGSGSTPVALSATAIGNAFFNGVSNAVAALYPFNVTRFEGPRNEPSLPIAETVQEMKLFQAAVHAGNASAKAIGPSFVEIINESSTNQWASFIAAGGAAYCDELATHMYNAIINGDINCGRNVVGSWVNLLNANGLGSVPRWQTESTWVNQVANSVHHPRRGGRALSMTLLLEEFGIPRERNAPWYDWSHGFWGVEAWIENSDGSLEPSAALYRTLAEETWGMNYSKRLSLPNGAERLMLAHLYTGTSGNCAIFQLGSYMPSATVTVATSASSLTVVDGFGNTSSVSVSGGQATINVSDIPTYVRLPTGTTLNVVTFNGWPTSEKTLLDSTHTVTISGTATTTPVNGHWLYSWDDWAATYPNGGGMQAGTAGIPDSAVFKWATNQSIRRVLIFSGPTWQRAGTLLTFTVDTSTDGGTTWTTQKTIDVSGTTGLILAASDQWNTGTQYDTYWPEQYNWDIDFGANVTCNAVRINVSAATYGGEPTSTAYTVSGNGTGWSTPQIVLQQVVFRG